jgi:hypothetical protein
VRFDLAGHVSLAVRDADPTTARTIRSAMRPFDPVPDDESPALVELFTAAEPPRLIELQHPAGDDITTATDGHGLFLLAHDLTCSIPNAVDDEPSVINCEPRFPVWRLVRPVLRPVLGVAAAARGSAAVHAASVIVERRAVLVAGWSETGKTETALALCERGAVFLSDKWTFVGSDGTASTFPISIGVRRWVLEYLPHLAAAVPKRARAQFAVAGLGSAAIEPVRRLRRAGRSVGLVADALGRTAALGQRAAFEVDEIEAAYGATHSHQARVPIQLVTLLVTSPPGTRVSVEEADQGAVVTRLARAAAYERRSYFELLERAGYGIPGLPASAAERAIVRDEAAMNAAFDGVRTIVVRAPFPSDPGPAADTILRALT